jgi:hypothetical protein
MKLVARLLVVAMVAAAWPTAAAPEDKKGDKEELLTLYLLSIAADRCAFPMTAKQADAIDQGAKTLVDKLKLGARENDAVYSEADVTFERQGRSACDRNGNFAKGFRRTLQRVTSP